jgi:TatD DNase family protein
MLIDAHAHVDRYGDALAAALQEIERHRIFTISNSMGLEAYQRSLEIAAQCSWVLPIFGVHPWEAVDYDPPGGSPRSYCHKPDAG